ncbi:universal stress protein [Photobacterium sp. DA100]|uniref:universal stress protein n=1 Tax=Photobacterium sp. DA100 TaxID=3027472 RepID=UPI0024784668|nr:universal stress protein [Photobacterium sp. DA100]WEM41005.1 universal stress protein [Photobacterium sp. DA100]
MSYQNIMLALDFDDNTDAILRKTETIAQAYPHAKLNIIHVNMDFEDYDFGIMNIDLTDYEKKERSASIQAMKEQLQNMEVAVDKYLVCCGVVENEIRHSIKEHNIDLLIMGHHKTNALTQIFSEAAALVRNMPCDLLLVKI